MKLQVSLTQYRARWMSLVMIAAAAAVYAGLSLAPRPVLAQCSNADYCACGTCGTGGECYGAGSLSPDCLNRCGEDGNWHAITGDRQSCGGGGTN